MDQLMEFSLIMGNKIRKYTNGLIAYFDDKYSML